MPSLARPVRPSVPPALRLRPAWSSGFFKRCLVASSGRVLGVGAIGDLISRIATTIGDDAVSLGLLEPVLESPPDQREALLDVMGVLRQMALAAVEAMGPLVPGEVSRAARLPQVGTPVGVDCSAPRWLASLPGSAAG
eukprot:2839660-Pyramimonas_sp.AAC.1